MGADALIPPLPPGFQADPPPPPGFQIDEPRAAAPARGLAPRTGAAAVPTAEEVATGVYTAPAPTAPRPEIGIKDRVKGAVEAGVELLAQFTGGAVGLGVGTVEGIGASVAAGQFGTPEGAAQAQQVAAKRAEQGVDVARRGLQLLNPMADPAAKVQILTGGAAAPLSPAAEGIIEPVQDAINSLPAAGGVYGSLQGPGMMAAGGVRPMLAKGLEGPTQAIRSVADQVIDRVAPAADAAAAAGTKPSAGAAGTDLAKMRRERAAALPSPVPLTKGDATREIGQQQLERDIAKDAEAGRDVRSFRAGQDERVAENFDILEEQTGAQKTTAEGAGDTVVGVLEGRKQRKLKEIRDEYEKARQAGETAELVPTDELVQLLNESRSSERNAGVIGTAADELVRLGGAVRDKDGYLLPSTIDINALEEVRKTVGVGGKKDATNSLFASKIRERIDSVLDDAGGDVYKGARKLYADYAKEFSNQSVLRDLLASKKGTTDRTVAMERVYRRIVGEAAPVQDLRNLKRTLQAEGDAGKRAWAELQGEAIRQLREATFRTRAKNERGMKLASDAGLNNALKQLDRNGKLDELFGKQGAQTLRDLGEVVADVYTPTADVTNPSGTGAYLKRMVVDMLTSVGTGLPLPLTTISKFVSDYRAARKNRMAVADALRQADPKALERRADTGARPFELPPGEATAPRETPPNPPRGGGGGGGGGSAQPGLFDKPAAGATKRERELVRLREQTTDPDVIKDLDAEIASERKRETARKKGEEYLRLADQTGDPELKRRLEKKAADLGARREKIPAGKARELTEEEARAMQPEPAVEPREPLGDGVEVIDVTPEVVDAVAAFTANAEARADWQRTHRFGDLDARTAEDVARALQYDAAATEGAVQQLERSPRAFEREIRRIIEEGEARARETKQAAGGGEGSAGQAGGDVPPRVPAGEGQPRADGNAAPAAQRREPAGTGRQQGSVGGEAVQRAADYLNDRPEIPAQLREGILERYRLAERAKPLFDERVRAAAAQLGGNVADILLAPIKFPTRAVAKILADYRGDPTGIKDLVRGTIVLRDIGSAKDAIAALEKNLGKLEGLRNSLDENLPAPTEDGYRDIKANVVIDGLPTEIQINVPEMIAAKSEAHPLYERVAEIERKADAEQRDLTPEEAAERQELKTRQRRIYDSAWEAATRLRKSGSDSNVPLREIDSSGKRRGSAASNARGEVPPSSATGTPSTSKNVVPAGKDLGSSTGITSGSSLADAPSGRQTIATTERGVEIPVLYRAVDVGQLITSHDNTLRVDPRFPAELQPRDRSRQASELQITRIENDIKPNLLAESYKASDGAPIVGADGVVESGNARTIALRRAYGGGKADHYREWLIENASRFGLDPAQVRKMKQPMLIRQGLGEYDRAEFARQANESAVSAMSETEQARSDAARMPDLEGLEVNDAGEMLQGASSAFIRDFLRTVVSPNERNAMVTADGKLSQRGAMRIRNAIFAKAYGDADIVAMLTEATDGNVKNILAGMLRSSPGVARIRELIAAGARPPVEFVPDLLDAVRRFSKAREDGMKVEQVLAQAGMFGDEASPRVAALMRELEDNARAPKRVAEMIQRFVDEIDQQGDPREGALFEQRPQYGKLAEDLDAQQVFLAQRASAAGFDSLDEWVASDFAGFMRAADEWRERNPAEALTEAAPPLLSAQTPADLKAKAEREVRAAAADKAEQQRLADKAKADAMRDEFVLTGSDRAADNPNQGSLFDERAPYTVDLFGEPVQPPQPAKPKKTAGLAPPTPRVDAPAGNYATRAALVTTRQQKLGHKGPVKSLSDAAHALAYLGDSAVERLDVLVTDAAGKPLGVVGGFKGALSQTSVYPATIMGEVMQIPGAARIWLVHNHPSGKSALSTADRYMAKQIEHVFDGSAVKTEGILAVGNGEWSGAGPADRFEGFDTGTLSLDSDGGTVPAQERQLTQRGTLAPEINTPLGAKQIVADLVRQNGGRPTLVLLNAQHAPVASIPWNPTDALPLKGNGKLDALMRAVAQANAGAAFIGLGEKKQAMKLEQAQNIGAALAKVDIRLLDIIDSNNQSAAEKGLSLNASVLRSIGAGAAALGLGATAFQGNEDSDGE